MSAFTASTYSAEAYKAFRPSYGPSLLDLVASYHKGGNNLAVDLGCGTGQATLPLASRFQRVLGLDPSEKMVASASSTAHPSNVSFAKGSDSDLSAVDGQIDLVLGAQTAHWWNIPTFLPLIRAKAAPKCTIALCGYTLVNSRTHPRITELVRETAYGDSKLGPFWEAGREELEDGYPNIEKQLREGGVSNIQRIEFLGKRIIQSGPGFPADAKPFVELDMTLAAFKNYLGTWSSYNTWKQQHPKLAGTEDDHIVSLINQVRAELGAQGQNDEDIKVELDWPHFLICGEI